MFYAAREFIKLTCLFKLEGREEGKKGHPKGSTAAELKALATYLNKQVQLMRVPSAFKELLCAPGTPASPSVIVLKNPQKIEERELGLL